MQSGRPADCGGDGIKNVTKIKSPSPIRRGGICAGCKKMQKIRGQNPGFVEFIH